MTITEQIQNAMKMLPEWHWEWRKWKTKMGQCNHDRKRLLFSIHLDKHEQTEVHNVIYHEVAHALVGPGHGHGRVWKLKCKELGIPANIYCKGLNNFDKWKLQCPKCDKNLETYIKRPKLNKRSKCCKEMVKLVRI